MLLTSIEQDFLTAIENTCILFGSRSIGVHTVISDYDYFTDSTNMDLLVLYLTYNEIGFEYKKAYMEITTTDPTPKLKELIHEYCNLL